MDFILEMKEAFLLFDKVLEIFKPHLIAQEIGHYLGQPKFFSEKRLKLHGELWAKTWLDTNFQPLPKSFDHVYEAPKVPR